MGEQQPAAASPAGLQSVTQTAEPADLGKVKRDKSQLGQLTGPGHGQVSRRYF